MEEIREVQPVWDCWGEGGREGRKKVLWANPRLPAWVTNRTVRCYTVVGNREMRSRGKAKERAMSSIHETGTVYSRVDCRSNSGLKISF